MSLEHFNTENYYLERYDTVISALFLNSKIWLENLDFNGVHQLHSGFLELEQFAILN